MLWIYLLIATNYIKILWDVLICLVCMKDFFSFMWFKLTGKIHSFSKQYFFSLLKQDPSASGGASLERSGEKDLVFIKGRFCRYCFKNEWTLASKISQKIRFCRTFIWHLMPYSCCVLIHVKFGNRLYSKERRPPNLVPHNQCMVYKLRHHFLKTLQSNSLFEETR